MELALNLWGIYKMGFPGGRTWGLLGVKYPFGAFFVFEINPYSAMQCCLVKTLTPKPFLHKKSLIQTAIANAVAVCVSGLTGVCAGIGFFAEDGAGV